MCHLLGEGEPGRELEPAEGTHRPTVAPILKVVLKIRWRERGRTRKLKQNRCCCCCGSGGRWAQAQTQEGPSGQFGTRPPQLPATSPHVGTGGERNRYVPNLNALVSWTCHGPPPANSISSVELGEMSFK